MDGLVILLELKCDVWRKSRKNNEAGSEGLKVIRNWHVRHRGMNSQIGEDADVLLIKYRKLFFHSGTHISDGKYIYAQQFIMSLYLKDKGHHLITNPK